MGEVIALFKENIPAEERGHVIEEEGIETLLNDDMAHSITDVQWHVENLFNSASVEEFMEEVRYIKGEIKRWPSG